MAAAKNQTLDFKKLAELVRTGAIDTVIAAFPDHLGRLVGKRYTGAYFVETAAHGMEACDYLLTVDAEMNPLPGFAMASWARGYGDTHVTFDEGTLRLLPWQPGTALVLGDLEWENGEPVAPAPRGMLKKMVAACTKRGLTPMMASELEFYLFRERYEDISARGFASPKPSSDYIIDYHILQCTKDEDVNRAIRNGMDAARVPVENSKGEWGKGQQEINLRYAEAVEMADRHVIYKNGVKEIAWQKGCCATFMAKYDSAEAGSGFHLHTSMLGKDGKANKFWDEKSHGGSKLFRQFLGGLLKYAPELFLFFAPTVNSYKRYQAGTFAPTAVAWSKDNRTTGFRIVGHGKGFRIENRMPGADGNPYLAFAATLAAGLAGVDEGLDCGDAYVGDAYQDTKLPRVPASLAQAADMLEKSALAKKAFGEETVAHYVLHARLEQQAYDAAVTDWERRRYFDRI